MKKIIPFVLLLCFAAAGLAEAGQFRIVRPDGQRRRQPQHGRRESRLEIVNEDDRGYAIDVDYRRNRLTLEHRARGDIYVPGNSSITLFFDDDDNWRIEGDNESLEIEIRAGRTSTLRLETRFQRNQVGLFATSDDGGRRRTAQLFRYGDRPGRPGSGNRPPVVVVPQPAPPVVVVPAPQRPHQPPPPRPHHDNRGSSLGNLVGDVIDSLIDDDRRGGPRR